MASLAGRVPGGYQLLDPHGRFGERFGLNQQRFVGATLRSRLAADDHHQRDRHRRDPVDIDMHHGCRRSVDQPHQPTEFGHPVPCVVPRCAKQQVVGFIFAKHVVNEIGRKADLPTGLALARVLPFDQASDHSYLAKGVLEQVGALDPFDELALQYIGGE